ncbi:RTA1 domain-containingprotein [Purpureocillium lavendulum]|uniref:RTA1 domain-containingprotein n=1 Tax=Purpureocillium lavendulum TaxID=1247861 RepID=A0AB34G7C1_9HYPO|nr:RTA1 domain-containingprotein [Purpureocillium lavendulum]
MATPTPTLAPTRTSTATSTETCISAVPDRYGHVPPGSCDSYYEFYPSFGGNLAFAVLFGLSTLVHLAQAIAFKKRFCWVVIMGSVWETAAFIIRVLGTRDQQQMQYAIWGQLLFLLAPLWINAFVYMTVARMVHFGLPSQKIWGIRAARMTLLFVWLDIACFLVQGAGGSMLSGDSPANVQRIGSKLYMSGVGLQLGFVLIFIVLTVCFYRDVSRVTGGRMGLMRWLTLTMIAVLLFIVMRIVYRLIEFSPGAGRDNPLLTSEIYPFILDAFPMLVGLVLLNVMHPGFVLRGPDSEFPRLTRAEKKAIKAQKKEDKRRRKEERKRGKAGSAVSEYALTDDMRRGTGSESDWERPPRV